MNLNEASFLKKVSDIALLPPSKTNFEQKGLSLAQVLLSKTLTSLQSPSEHPAW